ncbi:MAG: outer membrane lipid asymmetry maintenance protein MlaD [Nitrospirae bacterium]|nr:outer membrane lipid asymmetry maintenance protein MlaD [Nitrospirota bacterium]MEC4672208.1 outer membrane lipid asymmetry maintenance protein MlaD [Nitrospirota bacterium]
MQRGRLELAVGVFVVLGILSMGYLALKLGKLELVGGGYYDIHAEFSSASGLKPGAPVEIAGVQVGRVKTIGLNDSQASVTLALKSGIEIYSDAIASIKSRGIIGEKFMELSPGGSGDLLRTGDTILDTEAGIDLEQVISQFIHGNVE